MTLTLHLINLIVPKPGKLKCKGNQPREAVVLKIVAEKQHSAELGQT